MNGNMWWTLIGFKIERCHQLLKNVGSDDW